MIISIRRYQLTTEFLESVTKNRCVIDSTLWFPLFHGLFNFNNVTFKQSISLERINAYLEVGQQICVVDMDTI